MERQIQSLSMCSPDQRCLKQSTSRSFLENGLLRRPVAVHDGVEPLRRDSVQGVHYRDLPGQLVIVEEQHDILSGDEVLCAFVVVAARNDRSFFEGEAIGMRACQVEFEVDAGEVVVTVEATHKHLKLLAVGEPFAAALCYSNVGLLANQG